jgi:hypothetical protein
MLRLGPAVVALAALLVNGSLARGEESLTAAAEREKARRAGQQADPKATPAKTYTDEDLKTLNKDASKEGTPREGSTAEAARASVSSDEPAEEEDPAPRFRERVAEHRREIAAQQERIKTIEARIAELRAERSRPTRLTEVNRDQSINQDIVEATASLEEAKQALAAAEDELEATVEEARRAGVPYSQLE